MLKKALPLIIIDSHVHIHGCFFIANLLDSALNNFQKYLKQNHLQQSPDDNHTQVLLLTEITGTDYFAKLVEYAQHQQSIDNWSFKLTQETTSICAQNSDGKSIYLIAGRQVVTQEKLEVLSLISHSSIRDGLTLEETINQVIASGGLPVLPWGFGKWLGNRGELLERLLTNHKFPYLFLGDNGGRPQFWKRSPYFELAHQKQIKILPGSDLLALKSETARAGSFGFTLNAKLDPATPGRLLRELLINPDSEITPYGKLQNPLKFCQNQLAIRL